MSEKPNERIYRVAPGYRHFVIAGDYLLYCTASHRPMCPTAFSRQTEAICLIPSDEFEAASVLYELFKARADFDGIGETNISKREIERLVHDLRAEWEWVDD